MKTSIAYLPQDKQDQLAQVVQGIVDMIQPEKVILYGSYARNKWVEDTHLEGHILHEYLSDYDLLIITQRGESREESDIEEMVENRFDFNTPVSPIAHTIDFVNTRLREGHYFFSDIKEEGILLYDAGNIPLAKPSVLTPAERKQIATDDFEHWYGDAEEFLVTAQFQANRKLNIAAFLLHQATERAYAAVLLVFTGYKPRTHNLGKLLHKCKEFAPELADVFPRKPTNEKYLFELLKKAYIDARYKKNYKIIEEQLNVLIDRIKQTHAIVERVCREQIAAIGFGD
ncbi:MAG: HEPN domain-containing protein [Flavipsychrobacter sp.]|nr:HEPN domain-containing protein [Flavipsychrobacter sp.]